MECSPADTVQLSNSGHFPGPGFRIDGDLTSSQTLCNLLCEQIHLLFTKSFDQVKSCSDWSPACPAPGSVFADYATVTFDFSFEVFSFSFMEEERGDLLQGERVLLHLLRLLRLLLRPSSAPPPAHAGAATICLLDWLLL